MIEKFLSRSAFLFLALALLCPCAVYAANAPALFFSDIQSGPNSGGESVTGFSGAYVTLYGNFFGSSQGSSTVTLNGANCLRVVSWGGTWLSWQRIIVQLGATCTTGNFVVSTSAGSSNGFPFTVRSGHIYFVATTGNNANAGTFASPLATVPFAVHSKMVAGDITYVRAGVIAQGDDGFGSPLNVGENGTAGNPLAIVGYPGELPQLGGPSNGRGVIDLAGTAYFTIANFKFLFSGASEALHLYATSSNWRLIGNDLSCPNGSGATGCVTSEGAPFFTYLGNVLHDTGCPGSMTGSYAGCLDTQKLYHGFYFGDLGANANHDAELGWNWTYNIYGCRGMMFHSRDGSSGLEAYNLKIHDNLIHDVRCDGIALPNTNPNKGPVLVYNNIIYHTGSGPDPSGIPAGYSCILTDNGNGTSTTPVEVYNNTCYDGGGRGVAEGDAGAYSFYIPTRMRNNITYQLSAEGYVSGSAGSGRITGSNNLWFGVGSGPSQTTANINSDPLLISAVTEDFHLTSGSPAIDAGVNTGLGTDFFGVSRPQGSGIDVGAAEFSNGAVVIRPNPPTNLSVTVQ
jgi:hypothetical protein